MSRVIQPAPPVAEPVLDGLVFSRTWSGWFRRLTQVINGNFGNGFSGTIVTAKLTTGGTNGSMTFVNGVLISQTAAT